MKSRSKLGRKSQHKKAMLANMVVSLIQHSRIKTTLAKAKALRPVAEKIVTIGKEDTLHHRRLAISKLLGQRDAVTKLFKEIAPKFKERNGGYTRIIKLGERLSDAAPTAFIEWVDDSTPPGEEPAKEKVTKKTSSKKKTSEKSETTSTAPATESKDAKTETEPKAVEVEVEVESPKKKK